MAQRGLLNCFIFAIGSATVACGHAAAQAAGAVSAPRASEEHSELVIRAYDQRPSGVHAGSPNVKLSVARDPTLPGEPVLFVEYPPPSNDPAGRDVWCDAERGNWASGHAISFRIKPDHECSSFGLTGTG